MTKEEEIWVATENLLGSDVQPDFMQEILDHEHEILVPGWNGKECARRRREAWEKEQARRAEQPVAAE